ncbi:MAG: glucose-1-phosphate thymidylyltransferase [Bdellovibrionota bacterium]
MNVPRETFLIQHYIDLELLWFRELFHDHALAWSTLAKGIKETWIESHIQPNAPTGFVSRDTELKSRSGGEVLVMAGAYIQGEVELGEGVVVEPGAYIQGPTILGPYTQVRQGAYIRGGVITGEHCVIGHTSEVKSSIFCNGAKAAHFAYVGDSILGTEVNLGAGTKISNLKITDDEVTLRIEGEKIDSGLRKFGAILGDGCQTGCNSVLNPGSLLGPSCMVYPAIAVKNQYYPPHTTLRGR